MGLSPRKHYSAGTKLTKEAKIGLAIIGGLAALEGIVEGAIMANHHVDPQFESLATNHGAEIINSIVGGVYGKSYMESTSGSTSTNKVIGAASGATVGFIATYLIKNAAKYTTYTILNLFN